MKIFGTVFSGFKLPEINNDTEKKKEYEYRWKLSIYSTDGPLIEVDCTDYEWANNNGSLEVIVYKPCDRDVPIQYVFAAGKWSRFIIQEFKNEAKTSS